MGNNGARSFKSYYQSASESNILGEKNAPHHQFLCEMMNSKLVAIMLLQQSIPESCVSEILEMGSYTPKFTVQSSHQVSGEFLTYPYLQMDLPTGDYLAANGFQRECVGLEIECQSHDQGWSSYPQHRGTYDGSYTWGELVVLDENNETICEEKVYTNLHAERSWQTHHYTVKGNHPLLKDLHGASKLVFQLRSMYPGWKNFVRSGKLTIHYLIDCSLL